MKLKEIAERIAAHLKRFEADPELNKYSDHPRNMGTRPYFHTNSWVAGRYVGVKYISYQGSSNLTKEEAIRYLEWLDTGNIGRHWEALKDG